MVFPNRGQFITRSAYGILVLIFIYLLLLWPGDHSSIQEDKRLDDMIAVAASRNRTNAAAYTTTHNQYDLVKVVYGATPVFGRWEDKFTFDGCSYKCILKSDYQFKDSEQADVVLFLFEFASVFPNLSSEVRQRQTWLLVFHEPPAKVRWSSGVNHIYNGTMTFRSDSDVFFPYGMTARKSSDNDEKSQINVFKDKGAFAYVSDCHSINYDRLGMMRRLQKYIDVDIFGSCTNIYPCARMDFDCENKIHSQYRFFLSFENSLCKDYITEKFWHRISSPSKFLLVALGGTELSEYTKVAPPDSFLHLYNFTSVDGLGKYLQFLANNTEAFNRYFKWRDSYEIVTEKFKSVGCKLCELAHKNPHMPEKDLASWWNPPGICKDLTIN